MTKLEYTFKNDILFKMLFVQYPGLLKKLIANLLSIPYESIGEFIITNPEIPPQAIGEKFCRLDINMTIDGKRVDLEIQVNNERNYRERSLYYWAREYSSSLSEGEEYRDLPQAVIISILGFKLFACAEFHSEYAVMEVTRHTRLTDKLSLHYFELPKLPKAVKPEEEQKLWLSLFKAETKEELQAIETLEVPMIQEAIQAYHRITATSEFREIERLRSRARHDEASALGNARREAARETDEKWQGVVAEKDAALAEKDAFIAELRAKLGEG